MVTPSIVHPRRCDSVAWIALRSGAALISASLTNVSAKSVASFSPHLGRLAGSVLNRAAHVGSTSAESGRPERVAPISIAPREAGCLSRTSFSGGSLARNGNQSTGCRRLVNLVMSLSTSDWTWRCPSSGLRWRSMDETISISRNATKRETNG